MIMEPSFDLRGDLKDFAVNRLLQAILAEDLNGCLTVSRDSISRRLYLKDGMITYASSTERSDRLGEILVAQGLLTREEVDNALKKGSPMRRLGMILLVDGMITPQELFQGVSAQVVTILERMRSWRKGTYEFEVRREPKPGTVLLRIPLALYLGQAIKSRQPGPKKEEEPVDVPVGLNLVDDEAEVETAPPGPPDPEDDLTPDNLFEEGLPEADDDEGIEITLDEEEERGAGGSYGELELDGEGDDTAKPGERQDIVEEIAFQVQELRGRLTGGPHRILGVSTTARVEEVKESFDYFSRLLHPDKLPPDLPPEIAGPAADLYKSVVAAYEEISVKASSPKPDSFAAPPGRILNPSPPPNQQQERPDGELRPRRAYFRARKLMEKGNYWGAAESLREAVRQQPDEAEYRNLLGVCLIQTGRRLHEAEEHIKEAIRLDPGNPDYVTSLGLAYKGGRFFKKARRMFEQALLYDKGHARAKRELRNLPVDAGRSDRPKNIWSKLFGK